MPQHSGRWPFICIPITHLFGCLQHKCINWATDMTSIQGKKPVCRSYDEWIEPWWFHAWKALRSMQNYVRGQKSSNFVLLASMSNASREKTPHTPRKLQRSFRGGKLIRGLKKHESSELSCTWIQWNHQQHSFIFDLLRQKAFFIVHTSKFAVAMKQWVNLILKSVHSSASIWRFYTHKI